MSYPERSRLLFEDHDAMGNTGHITAQIGRHNILTRPGIPSPLPVQPGLVIQPGDEIVVTGEGSFVQLVFNPPTGNQVVYKIKAGALQDPRRRPGEGAMASATVTEEGLEGYGIESFEVVPSLGRQVLKYAGPVALLAGLVGGALYVGSMLAEVMFPED